MGTDERDEREANEALKRNSKGRPPLDADESPDFAEEYDHPSGVLDPPRAHPDRP